MANGEDVWVWVGHVWSGRVQQVLREFGDRITDVSIFCQSVNADGSLTQTFNPNLLIPYREMWPHIRFWLGYRNDGRASIFTALRNSPAAQDQLVDELSDLLDLYPWMVGVDTDLEQGGGSQNSAGNEVIFRKISDMCHGRGLLHAAALPPLTSSGSVGNENWVRYKQLGEMLDHLCIMSYDFAWMGSAPGPTSPGFWMRNIYDWVTSQVDPAKVSWGLPLYMYAWRLHDYPNNSSGWRGNSGAFYAAYGWFSGHLALDGTYGNPAGTGAMRRIAWVVYRDPDSQACWGLVECYDFVQPTGYESSSGITSDSFDGRPFVVRYGRPSGSPQWSVADNGPGTSHATYEITPREAVDYYGQLVAPAHYNLTVEILQRVPVAATIIDDYASSAAQLANIYNVASGSWSFWQRPESTYKQYRGSGRLNFAHNFGTQSLYALARFQMNGAGYFRVHVKGITAEVSNLGVVKIIKDGVTLAQGSVGAIPTNPTPGAESSRRVLALRVRENSARLYFGGNENGGIPLRLTVNTTPGADSGIAGYSSTNQVWIDHTYLGDGWWYQPREAVRVQIGAESRTLGRIPRTGVTWDAQNRFRPDADVEETATRDESISLDWTYAHWVHAPFVTNETSEMKIIPQDHDVWIGRAFAFNSIEGAIAYWQDSQTIAYWKAVAGLEYGISGIALWTVGQEDIRIWDALGEGELSPDTRIVQG